MFASPSLVNAQVPRDGVKPRREFGLPLVSLCALDDAHEGLLQQILRRLAIADVAKDEVVDGLAMTRQQHLEGADLALLVHDHQLFISLVAHLSARNHTNTITNGQASNPLRGLTRWTVIRCPSLVDGTSDRVTASRAWLACSPIDPQIIGILACGTVGIDEVAQARS